MTSRYKKPLLILILTSVLFLQAQPATSGGFDINLASSIKTPGVFENFSEEMGLAISYLPLAPAEPLGTLGFDIGLEITAIDIDQSLWRLAIKDDPPGTVVLPKLHIQKGLPFGIDIGATYTKAPGSNIKVIGGEIKYALVSGNAAIPAIAIRGSYTTLSGVEDLDLETMGADISISKGFVFVTPYAGYGQVWIKSEEKVTPLKLKSKTRVAKPFVGVKLSLALINFVFEADFGKTKMYTGRFNVGF